MKIRQLTWDDVEVTLGDFYDSKNNIRVYCRLKNAAYVSFTGWYPETFDENKPETRAMIMLLLHKKLAATLKNLGEYIQT